MTSDEGREVTDRATGPRFTSPQGEEAARGEAEGRGVSRRRWGVGKGHEPRWPRVVRSAGCDTERLTTVRGT